ncbi:serine protease [Blastopirellula marina]|uniref:Serine protease n=1 Tax=Blastopirellula marina TaxID=124 RepID=A0A2S8F585_9BACT|nr:MULTISPECIES: serine protease [Pirellulaceae]PQO27308.1 serine protease [Blastopirellula marina]RCS47845.1 serine protease [Bremerella cremea]
MRIKRVYLITCLRIFPLLLFAVVCPSVGAAQSVCLPAPRLLTTLPMGGQAGTTVDVTISGENLDDLGELRFSHPGITAAPKMGDDGIPLPNQYSVTISPDCPAGVHEARIMSRLGLSSSRVFSVGKLPEIVATESHNTLETATPLQVNSICNGQMKAKAIDYYTFEAKKGQRLVVTSAAAGIDSKLKSVLIVADEDGNDLQVERRGGAIDFTPEADGKFVIKVHDLTYGGGPYYFYRLAVEEIAADAVVPRPASTRNVNAFSWPPTDLALTAASTEVEPNNQSTKAQQITLPCDIEGSFFPAADIDTFEFTAKKGEVWWVEVASERLGLPTDPSITVNQVKKSGDQEEEIDVTQLSDIPSPVKVSSNGYSYDGPPYNAGSSDILGKVEIKEDGVYRLRLTDLFGGTRDDERNIYRLIIRKAQPDFAIVGWALHMNLRNGDRNALSKPIALRGGATMPIEVVVVRRDGYDGPIELGMENLPEGVTASGLTIPPGKCCGTLLVTAEEHAPRGLTSASLFGRAEIDGKMVTRQGSYASMAWPVTNAWSEIPSPRLLADVPVSVGGSETTPLSVSPTEDKVWEVVEGQSLTIPLTLSRRCEFSGPTMSMKTFGEPFDKNGAFDVSLKEDSSEVSLDLAKLKPAPGTYTIAFYGSAVAKYSYNTAAVTEAELALEAAKKSAEQAPEEEQEKAKAAVTAAEKRLQTIQKAAAPKDIVDIIVSKPIQIRVIPATEVTSK